MRNKSDFIVSWLIYAASKSTSELVHEATSYERPSELMFDRPLTTIPVRGRVRPVNDAKPASVIFLQYETSKNVNSFSFDTNLIVWSSTAFSQPENCNSYMFGFYLSKN